MKISLLAFTASVQATFQAPGKIPNTGNRRHFMTLRTVTDENGQEKTGGIAYGADYGMSGDLVSGNMFNTWLEAAEESGEDVDIKDKILWGQVQNDETWFYYQSPLNDQWYKAIYMPFEEPAFSQLGHEETKEINGTEVYGLFQCNDAIKKLYASEINGGTDDGTLKAECEEKCRLYTVATDFTNAKDCNDPAGSLPIGAEGNPHPWLAPLYEFIETVEEKVENGDATNYILDFEAPHTVGSKIFPELEDGEPDDVNATQIANTIADLENLNKDNITATFGGNDIEVICRLLRSGGADVICGDETETTETEPTEVVDDKVEEDDDSGFVINSVSLALFAVIAIFK